MPNINFRYFEEGNDKAGEDLDSVVSGVETVRRIAKKTKDLFRREVVPGDHVKSKEKIKDFIRNKAWGHHASCTCKIGSSDDGMAVLDGDFRVHGTKSLRVVDASVFPRIPGFFIVTSVYMIGEKAADVIAADGGVKLRPRPRPWNWGALPRGDS